MWHEFDRFFVVVVHLFNVNKYKQHMAAFHTEIERRLMARENPHPICLQYKAGAFGNQNAIVLDHRRLLHFKILETFFRLLKQNREKY